MHKAFKIDATNRTITEVEVGDYKTIYPLLGEGVDMFECRDIDNHDTIYLDEEGMLKGPTVFFLYEGMNQPFAGNGLVMGTNSKGESVNPKITLAKLKQNVRFMDGFEARIWAMKSGL